MITKTQALDKTMQDIARQFGAGAIMQLGDVASSVKVIRTGSRALDIALGIGGWPSGRIVEIYGPEMGGKTTLVLHAIVSVQRTGGTAAFIDAEHALDVDYARRLGVDISKLLVAQPDNGEQALSIVEALARSGAVDLIVVDSVDAIVPRAEIEGEMGDSAVGLQARLMSQALRKLTSVTSRTGCTIIFTNQIRQKMGITFGNGEVTSGGNALKFYASVRVDIRRIGTIGGEQETIGIKTKIKVVKNKLAPPFRTAETEIHFDRGMVDPNGV